MNTHIPKATPILGEGVPVDFQTSEGELKGQILMDCCALYTMGKLLKRRCLKWARIVHLNI